MADGISYNHPLRRFFDGLVHETFEQKLGLAERRVGDYLSGLLTDFVHMDRIYCLRSAEGRRLDEIAEMMLEGDVLFNAGSFARERQVHKQIGDVSLFWTGVFPEGLSQLQTHTRKDHLINYVKQGKESYHIVSTFDVGQWREEAELFRLLSEQFELFMYGLKLVREQWERMAAPSGFEGI